MLTPEVFKSDHYGNSKVSSLKQYGASSSRLYCYKMDDYKDYNKLKMNLPHRKLNDGEWETISNNIGWMSFEDIYSCCIEFNTFENSSEADMIKKFFEERNLV